MAESFSAIGTYDGFTIYDASQEAKNSLANSSELSRFISQANSFSLPIGADPGYGYLLMRREDVLALIARYTRKGITASLVIGIDKKCNSQYQYVTLQKIVFVQATRIYPGQLTDPDSMMLVKVADKRYYGMKTFIDTQYNVRSVSDSGNDYYWPSTLYFDDTITDDPGTPCSEKCRPWTWREILGDIWDRVILANNSEVGFVEPTLPTEYDALWDSAPERVQLNCLSALAAYNLVLKQCGGFALGYDPIDDEFLIVAPGGLNADTNYATLQTTYREALLMEEEVLTVDGTFIPQKIRVVFESEYPSINEDEFFIHPKYTVEVNFSAYVVARSPSPVPETQTNAIEIINAKLDARIPISSTPLGCDECCPTAGPAGFSPLDWDNVPDATNATTLEDLAKQIAYRFWDHRVLERSREYVYEGCIPFRHGTKVLGIVWASMAGSGGWKTRLDYVRRSEQFFDQPTEPTPNVRDQRVKEYFMVSAEEDDVLGPAGNMALNPGAGFVATGSAYIINSDETVRDDSACSVDMTRFNAMVFPAYPGGTPSGNYLHPQHTFRAVKENGAWYAVGGGTQRFHGVIAADLGSNQYSVTPDWTTGTPLTCKSLFDEVLLVGQEVRVSMDGDTLWIDAAGCPPE